MGPNLILILAGAVATWVVLSIVGHERQRCVQEVAAAPKAAASAVPAPAKVECAQDAKAPVPAPVKNPAH